MEIHYIEKIKVIQNICDDFKRKGFKREFRNCKQLINYDSASETDYFLRMQKMVFLFLAAKIAAMVALVVFTFVVWKTLERLFPNF